ncbi:RNA-dependent RNA polymerase [Yichang Insect virus]|uniref:RNA-directed RNA polymerase L n=1 Tax=Yichang Insect virus TaxID=1608144 RepID=A0A0B5KXZ2_9VIRU|nr:RNA-dependent RNA polymerase [Yichang Insect virus]AJG39273.1 RNA-dependent RNA polymerase [Yichang Insect virus]
MSAAKTSPSRRSRIHKKDMPTGWSREELIGRVLDDVYKTVMVAGVLEVPTPTYRSKTYTLQVPQIDADNVQYDLMARSIVLNFDTDNLDTASASSIVGMVDFKIDVEQFRTFVHDYTFAILAGSTDCVMSEYFPFMSDGKDNRTPDLITSNGISTVVLEFGTTRNPTPQGLRSKFDVKRYTYEEALRSRVAKLSRGQGSCIKYMYSPIICNGEGIMAAGTISLPSKIVNELCARFRFARIIMELAIAKGLKIEEDGDSQLRSDLRAMIASIRPVFQTEGDEGEECSARLVPLTRERVVTDDVDPQEAYRFAAEEYKKLLTEQLKNVERQPNKLRMSDLEDEVERNTFGDRLDMKAVLQMPGVCCGLRSDWTWQKTPESDERANFINDIIEVTQDESWSWSRGKIETIRLAMMDSSNPELQTLESTRRTYKRVVCVPTELYRLEMAKLGVQGKDFKTNAEVSLYRETKKEGFSMAVSTDDIEEFINQDPEDGSMGLSPSQNITLEIINRGFEIQDETDPHMMPTIKRALQTPTGRWVSLMSAIGVELSISLKQNVDKDQFVVKNLKQYDAYLIIKPTRSDSHIFYMLVFKNDCHNIGPKNLTKLTNRYTEWSCTDWVSFSLSKLVNLTKAESFFLAQLSQWSRYYKLTFEEGIKRKEVWRMTRVMLLVHLEDKPRTEEIMTLFRYISMEKFSLVMNDNKKMLSKIPSVLRSRLQVWVTKCMLRSMASPNYEPSIISDGTSSKRLDRMWLNMINPYTGEAIEHPSQLVELYYAGYATNKDAKAWENTEFDLIKKIIQYENELDKADPKHCGMRERTDPHQYRFHEWSRKMNCATADHLKECLKLQYGLAYEDAITEKILYRLQRLTWDEVASLKATSNFDPSTAPEPNKSGKFSTKRMKMLIKTLKISGELEDTPALTFPKALEWVSEDGGLRVDLFKKNQHGGLREIYVMEIHSRIVQLVVEEISRALCQELDIEMMMHPGNKLRKPQEHMYKSARRTSPYKVNISSSNDAKVWNQGHHVAKFAQFLVRLLPPMWHGVIVNSLKQWTMKRMALPDGVMNFLHNQRGVPLWDPIHEEIRLAHSGLLNRRWMVKPGCHYLLVESGMMQGILHYMSSAFHASFLTFRNYLWKKLSNAMCIDSTSIDLVSSDDSSRMTDVFSSDEAFFRRSVCVAKADHLVIKTLSPLMGISLSPKSTLCSNGVMEFNSEFFFRASVFRPTLKWSLASLGIVEVESLVERQEVMNNQITELLEGGSGFRQAAETQVAQAMLHYKLLGSEVNSLYIDYIIQLLEMPDPSLGFFLMDKPIGAGLSGFNYNLWKAVQYSRRLSCLYASFIRQGELTTTTTGQLTRGAQVRFGNREKTKRLIESATEAKPNWREDLEANPEYLYMVAKNMESATLKMMVKLTSPSVIKAISGGNALARIMAASVYMINGLAVTLGSNWIDSLSSLESQDMSGKRVSLWRLITSAIISEEPLRRDEELVLFPQTDYYISLARIFTDLSSMRLAHYGSRKMLRSHIQVFPESSALPFSLEDMVKWRWFDYNLVASSGVLREVWDNYRKVYPWLADSPQETLSNADCHFESQIQLRNYVARQSMKSRSVHLTGAPVRDTTSRDLLVVALIRNQIPGYTLESPTDIKVGSVDVSDDLQSKLACYMTFPLNHRTREQKIVTALNDFDDVWHPSRPRPQPRKVRLGVIQAFIKMSKKRSGMPMRILRFKEYMKHSRLGVYGGFVKRQVLQGGVWIGEGEWRGVVGSASVSLTIKDSKLVALGTDSISDLRLSEPLLNGLMRELEVTGYEDSIIGSKFYDLRTISTGRGAPVYERRGFKMDSKLTFDKLELKISAESIRLVAKDDPRSSYTIVAYTMHPSDFKFNRNAEESDPVLRFWVNNQSLPGDWAEDSLEMLMKKGDQSRILDFEEFKKFVGESLPPSLLKAGLDVFSCTRSEASQLTEGPDPDFDEDMDFFDMGEDFVFDDKLLLETNVEVEMPELDNNIEFTDVDVILGEMPLEIHRSTLGNIRRVHNLWTSFSRLQVGKLSHKVRRDIEKGIYNSAADPLITILEFYCGMAFSRGTNLDVSNSLEAVMELPEPGDAWF